MKFTKEKLATWSFPIFIIVCVISIVLYLGVKTGISFYEENVANGNHRVRIGNITIQFPCKPQKSELLHYSCTENGVTYEAGSYSQPPDSDNICKKPDVFTETVPYEDFSYHRTYAGLRADICVNKSHTERGVNTGYRTVIARIESSDRKYLFSVSGKAQFHDAYSSSMENFLSSIIQVK